MAFKIKQGKYTHMSISVSELLKKEWPPHADEKLLWLAGYLESEGWFGIRKRISGIQSALAKLSFTTTDKDIADKVATLLDTKLYIRKPQKEYYKVGYLGIIDGKKAENLMTKLLPHMGERRSAKITEILNIGQKYPKVDSYWRYKLEPSALDEVLKEIKQGKTREEISKKHGICLRSISYFMADWDKHKAKVDAALRVAPVFYSLAKRDESPFVII